MFDDHDPGPGRPATGKRKVILVLTVLALLIGGSAFAVGNNWFGRNIHGTVYCATGTVTGVFVEADTLSRIGNVEVQSGSAIWQAGSEPNAATFNYWLPLGGMYSIHFGCLSLDGIPGGWGTDNRTPLINDDEPEWWCDNPYNRVEPAIVVTNCRTN